jgi:hypothetical protein
LDAPPVLVKLRIKGAGRGPDRLAVDEQDARMGHAVPSLRGNEAPFLMNLGILFEVCFGSVLTIHQAFREREFQTGFAAEILADGK